MNLIEFKCPNCGADLELLENRMVKCKFCGQIVALDEEAKTNINFKLVKENKEKTKNKSTIKWIMIVFGSIIVIGSIMLMLVGSVIETVMSNKNVETVFDDLTNGSQKCNRMFLSDVFEKDYKSITQEEKNSIKYLSAGYQDGDIVYEYSFHDYSEYSSEEEFLKTTKVWTIDAPNLQLSSDFTDFKGLTRFDYDEINIPGIKFPEECKLKYLTCSGDIKGLEKVLPVSQIEVLVINEYIDTLDGIEDFKNLTNLTVKSTYFDDISKLTKCPNLKELNLDSDSLSDFETLNKLEQLEKLTLNCDNLKTLEFVENMQDLETLNILDGNIYNVKSLKGLNKLKTLSLDADFEIDNFEVIGTLTNLESLYINVNTDNMDYLKELKNIRKLEISDLEDFSLLTPMNNLEELTLYDCWYGNAYLLNENKKLRSLTIDDSFGFESLDLSFLSDFKTIEEIAIIGDENIPKECHNFEAVFKIPSLETVKVNGMDITMDIEHIETNQSLKNLDLQFVSITNMDLTGEKEELELSNALEFVKNFPNLEVVTITSSKLDSIEWVGYLQNLRELDVTDNYISDFSVLNNLSKLERLVCSSNVNTNVKLDNDKVEIICGDIE